LNPKAVLAPKDMEGAKELEMGPNIKPLPKFEPLEDHIKGPVLLKMEDNVSTDEILPAGTKVLPFRSNIPEISKFTLSQIDENYYERAMAHQKTGSLLVGGSNYGQGSSREHAAITPRYLGVRAVFAKGYARIHRKNLINFGILPLEFENQKDYDGIDQEDILEIQGVHDQLKARGSITVHNVTKGTWFYCKNTMSEKEQSEVKAGSLINVFLAKHS
jgi:aconitate hydratase